MSMRTMIAVAAVAASAALPSWAVIAPVSAVSDGVNIVSAGNDVPSTSTVALETRYRTLDFSNFINMITEKIKGFCVIIK